MSRSTRGICLLELLVVVAIILVLVGLLLPAIHRIMEAADRARCEHNMQQLGVALHSFHTLHGHFPLDQEIPEGAIWDGIDTSGHIVSPPVRCANSGFVPSQLFLDVLPHLEEHIQPAVVTCDVGPSAAFIESHGGTLGFELKIAAWLDSVPAVSQYLCPSRGKSRDRFVQKIAPDGTAYVVDSGTELSPELDYASGLHPHFFSSPAPNWTSTYPSTMNWASAVGWLPSGQWNNRFSILGGVFVPEVALGQIGNLDGASNTFLLAHKGNDVGSGLGYLEHWSATSMRVIYREWVAGAWREMSDTWTSDKYTPESAQPWHHKRFPGYFGKDVAYDVEDFLVPNVPGKYMLTSPHSAMPVLFADGSVRSMNFKTGPDELARLWAWNDGE